MKKLIVIHGALGNGEEFEKIIPFLGSKYEIVNYEIPHHGFKQDSTTPFNMTAITEDFCDFLEEQGRSIIYGFSLGGYVALCAAQQSTKNIEGIITQGTKLDWSPDIAAKEVKGLDLDFLKKKAPPFYNYLHDLHGDYLNDLLEKTVAFMQGLGNNPLLFRGELNKVDIPVRMIRGGKDRMVSKNETINVCNMIGNCHYSEIPFFPHPLGFIDPKHIARLIDVQIGSLHYKWAQTDQGRMAYRSIGEIDNHDTCLLFLHEAIGSIAQWQDFPDQLAAELDLPAIIPEFPGYGFSDKSEKQRDANYLHHFATYLLPQFTEQVCKGKKLIIIGHSDGGTNALLFSARFKEDVNGIVTMAAHYINEIETRAGIKPAIKAFEDGKLKGLELFHADKTKHLFFNWARTWLTEDFAEWDISSDIKGSKIPSLIIQGSEDQYGTDQQVTGICQLLENATPEIISDCGHAPHLEQREAVIKEIVRWKEKLK